MPRVSCCYLETLRDVATNIQWLLFGTFCYLQKQNLDTRWQYNLKLHKIYGGKLPAPGNDSTVVKVKMIGRGSKVDGFEIRL